MSLYEPDGSENPGLLYPKVATILAAVAVGVPLTRALGVEGAVWSMALSEALAFGMAVVLLRRKARASTEAVPPFLVLSASE